MGASHRFGAAAICHDCGCVLAVHDAANFSVWRLGAAWFAALYYYFDLCGCLALGADVVLDVRNHHD